MTSHVTSLTELHELIRTGAVDQQEALRLLRAWQQGRQSGTQQPGSQQPGPTPATGTGTGDGSRHDALRERVCDVVTLAVSELLKVGPEDLDADVELSEYGLDSIVISQLVNAVNDRLGLALAPTVLFEHPNLRAFSAHLAEEHGPSLTARLLGEEAAPAPTPVPFTDVDIPTAPNQAPAPAPAHVPTPAPATGRFLTATAPATAPEAHHHQDDDPVAIVGMSCRFPGAADADEFWANLREGRDSIGDVPPDRWDWRAYWGDPLQQPGRTDVTTGGFIDGVADFDPLFFGIAPKEALHMDPQQRLLMLYVWKALEDAGHSADSLAGSDLALFVGTNDTGYSTLAERCGKSDTVSPTGGVPSLGPNRMSFFLDVHGPSEPVETACSSSLVALHRGVTAIGRGECETAVVGGVNTIVVPDGHVAFSRAGMLSGDGRCKTFSDRADGYGRGEGVGILVLKRLSAALRDGDHVYGVVRSSAVNHGGRANSLTAPNPRAQADLLLTAWKKAGVDPRTVGYIEAHGTGTPLGDPIEVNALKDAFAELYSAWGVEQAPESHCGLGSVKTNIGHLELASGVAGVIKVLLQMRHRTLAETLHCDTVNPYVELQGSPFRLVRKQEPWATPRDADGREAPRRAGVSSFGFGGTNAHVVLEEYVPPAEPRVPARTGPFAVLLSAKEPETLRARARQLIDWLDSGTATEDDLPRLSYTLQTGRVAMEERFACVAESLPRLRARLQEFLDGERSRDVRTGRADRRSPWNDLVDDEDIAAALGNWMAKGKLDRLLELWVSGAEFDWRPLWGAHPPRRIPLPAYPFRLQRYWIADGAETAPEAVRTPATEEHHRLLSGDEYFLRDHRVRGVPTLPGAMYLELVREAFTRVVPADRVLLRDVTWLRQLQITSPRTVAVTVDPDTGTYEVHADGPDGREVYARGTVSANDPSATGSSDTGSSDTGTQQPVPAHDIPALRAACPQQLTGEDCYARFTGLGLDYGPALRAVQTLHHGPGTALARLSLPEPAAGSDQLGLNPSMLDAALQTSLGVFLGEPDSGADPGTSLPFAVREVHVLAPTPAEGWAVARPAEGDRPGGTVRTVDIDLCDDAGNVCVQLRGFSTRTVPGAAAPRPALMIEPAWREEKPASAPAAAEAPAHHRVVLCELPAADEEPTHDALTDALGAPCELWQREGDIAARYTDYAQRLLTLLQEEARATSEGRRLVQIVTPSDAPWLGGLSGMLRTARQEHPRLLTQWIEADPGTPVADLAAVLRAEAADPSEEAVRRTGGTRRVPRWRETPPPAPRVPWRDGGVYLFTGGSGGLAALFAQDVARRVQQPTLILCGRSTEGPAQRELLGALRESGARAEYRALDVSDSAAVAAAVRDVQAAHGALHGVLHTAGVLRDGFLARKSAEDVRDVLAAKVGGLRNLDEATAGVELDFLIAFSSMAAFGNVGQSDYAAANAFMDGYAHHRESLRARGERHGRTLSVNWPLWEKGGMRGGAQTEALLEGVGMRLMQAGTGLDGLYRAWASELPSVIVLEGDHVRMRERLLPDQPQPQAPEARDAAGAAEATSAVTDIAPRVTALLTSLLEVDATLLRPEVPLREYGLDSIFLTQFLGQARKEFDSSLTLDAIAGCETLQDFVDEIERAVQQQPAPAAKSIPAAPAAPTALVLPSEPPEDFPELIPMNSVREGRPVFWVHHGNGGVESYAPVAERCPRPFYGIQPRGWTGSEDILTGQEAMAAYYAGIIRAVQPEGPYDIGGFSLGGLFAYEVVRQLQQQGATVDSLVMLDTLDAASTNRANSLMTGGRSDADTVAKVSAFRAVNLLLGNNSLDAEDGAVPVLHRDEVDTELDPEAFLDSLIEAAVARGIPKTPAQLRARVSQLARYFEAVHGEQHAVHPLPRRDEVSCSYVRNAGGKFFGPFEEYMVLFPEPDLPAVDGTPYWSEWADAVDDFMVVDVDTETHAQVMTEPAALKKVLRLCDRLYARQGGR